MPQASGDGDPRLSTEHEAVLHNLLGVHTAPPSRRSLPMRYAPAAALLLLGTAFAAAHLWVFAVSGVLLAVTLAWGSRSRVVGACTEVTALGVTIRRRGIQRDIAWPAIREVYPRAAWAPFPTLRLASGSTVSLPGVSEEQALRLEQARATQALVAAHPEDAEGQQ